MSFRPLVIGALYPGLARGLRADILATQALRGNAFPVCTAHVVAGRGTVTDVLNVPTDTVSAQIEHLRSTEEPTAVKIGIIGDAPTVEVTFEHVESMEGPVILDLTLSGPSGEDVLGSRGLDALLEHLELPDLVTLSLRDATLIAGMEIPSLDDAQVAVQRVGQQGAEQVLLRCGQLPTHHFDTESSPPDFAVDLYYDGDDFALFEAPYLEGLDDLHGASSGLTLPVLQLLQQGAPIEDALQASKARVTEALRAAQQADDEVLPTFFDELKHQPAVTETEA